MKHLALILLALVLLSINGTAQDLRIHFKGDSVRTYAIRGIDSLTFVPCRPDSLTVIATSPSFECVVTSLRPFFAWNTLFPATRPANLTYTLTLVEGKTGENPEVSINSATPVLKRANLTEEGLLLPSPSATLREGVPYVWRVEAFEGTRRVAVSETMAFHLMLARFPFDISEVLCCKNSLVTNGSLDSGKAGPMPATGTVAGWKAAYGAPVVSTEDGCDDPGFIELSGNRVGGQAIMQTLPATARIIQGKHYRVSFCIKFRRTETSAKSVRIRAVAFNGTLPSYGVHPAPGPTVAHIGQTGKTMHPGWVTTTLPVWRANKNFDAIAFYAFTDSPDSTAFVAIDNICIVETTDTVSCDDIAYSDQGVPIIPPDLLSYREPTITEVREYYEEERGSVSDLYGDLGNTALDTWYPNNNPCASIGGTVPLEAQQYDLDDSLVGLGFDGTAAEIDSMLASYQPDTSSPTPVPPIASDSSQCRREFVANNTEPFGGRDIIFVHGLQLNHLCDIKSGVSGADKLWPQDRSAFYAGGYFKNVANENWREHIEAFLAGRSNRYLIVTYNCAQRLDVAAHSILTQIRDAMNNGTGVISPKGGDSLCFGRNAVIISHSTGGPVTDVAMSIANRTKVDLTLRAKYGNIGFISDRMRAHVSLTGAQSGSRLATLVLSLQAFPRLAVLANAALAIAGCVDLANGSFSTLISGSILVDLDPTVMKLKWGNDIATTPVPVLAVSGGHPTAIISVVKYPLHPGLDDGVLTSSCASSNPNYETPQTPSGYFRDGPFFRVFDMGIGGNRGVGYYLDQTLKTIPQWVGTGSVTHLSATGMVQPVSYTTAAHNPLNRYPNHYSFIQSAADHIEGAHKYYPPDYDYPPSGSFENSEESRAITDPFVYASGLVSPAVAGMQIETVKGEYLTIGFHLPWVRKKKGFPFFEVYMKYFTWTITIWERRYHNLAGHRSKGYAHYVYDYVLRP